MIAHADHPAPAGLIVAPGTRVRWTNAGRNRHTATADDGMFDSGTLLPGADFAISAPQATGTYAYHCRLHAYIRGTLTVSTIALDAPETVPAGGAARLSGTVPGAAEGTPVSVQRRVPGAWVPVADVLTDREGAFSATSPPLSGRTAFRVVAAAGTSPSVRALVRPRVAAARRGARLVVRVSPALPGATARLERLDLDTYRWGRVATGSLHRGRTSFRLTRAGVYRAGVDEHGGLTSAVSAAVLFRPGEFRE